MQRFVQDKHFGILDKGSCQEAQTLFATGELQESTVSYVAYAKYVHP